MNAYYNERTIMENPSAFPMGEPNDGFNRLLVGDQGVERIACVVECGQNVCFFHTLDNNVINNQQAVYISLLIVFFSPVDMS